MSFLSGAVGGQSNFQAKSATGDAKFHEQNLQPAINTAQSDYSKQLAMANQVFGQQGDLASQLKAQSMGEGPNIAQMQLQQATDRANQQAAGALASARGLNPALAARLIAQNQAANNQAMAGQSGIMRANQQLAAQNALANVYNQQVGNAQGGGGLANQNLGINQQAQAAQNADIVRAQNDANAINAETARRNAEASQSAAGGFLSGVGGVLASPVGGKIIGAAGKLFGLHEGGEIPAFLRGGDVPSMVSPGERYIPPQEAEEVRAGMKSPMEAGHEIPGKAKMRGDSPKNDTVPAELEPGGVVLPRSVTKSSDPEARAREFMEALKKEKSSGPKGFAKVLELHRKMGEHIKDILEEASDK